MGAEQVGLALRSAVLRHGLVGRARVLAPGPGPSRGVPEDLAGGGVVPGVAGEKADDAWSSTPRGAWCP